MCRIWWFFPNSKRKKKSIHVPIGKVEKFHRLESAQCAFLDYSKTLVFSMCKSGHFVLLKCFLFLHCIFQLEDTFFVKAGSALDEVSISLWSAFKQVWQNYLIRLQRLDLEGWVVSSSFPVSQLLLWIALNHFHFRDVLWLRLCVTRVGFTHDKSVPFLFSTPQARSQQQIETLIHLLKKLALVNDIRGMLYLLDPVGIFSPRIW